MTVDRIELAGYTDEELLEEITRRRQELQRRMDALGVGSGLTRTKSPAKSAAKRAQWQAWRDHKAANPTASISEWRKLSKALQKAQKQQG